MKSNKVIQKSLLVSITLFLLLTTGRILIWGDAGLMCSAASSVVTQGSFEVPQDIRADVVVGRDGKSFAKYPILTVLQCTPMMTVLHLAEKWEVPWTSLIRLLGSLPLILLSLSFFLGLWKLLEHFEVSFSAKIVTSLLMFFSTPIWVHSRSYYGELLQAVLVVYFLLFAFRSIQTNSKKNIVAASVFLGLGMLTKSTMVLLGLPFLGVFLRRNWKTPESSKKLLFAALGFVPFLLIHLGYNFYRYGNILDSGYGAERDGLFGFGTPLAEGLFGLLFSSGKSLFLYAPILLSLFFLGRDTLRKWKVELGLLYGSFAIFLLISAKWWSWAGDWSWGPRLLVPFLPLFAFPLALKWEESPRARKALLILGFVGTLVQLLGVLVHPQDYLRLAAVVTRDFFYPEGVDYPNGVDSFVRDDLLFIHFVPSFSPLIGHAWLLLSSFRGLTWGMENYPWKDLSGVYAPQDYMFPNQLNLWPEHDAVSLFLAAFLLGIFLSFQITLWFKTKVIRHSIEKAPD